MIDLCLVGGLGRMGRAIAELAMRQTGIAIVSVWDTEPAIAGVKDYHSATGYDRNPVVLTSDGVEAAGRADVVVDFATAAAFEDVVKTCRLTGKPLVTGSTGISDKATKLSSLSKAVAVINAPNMAVGVNVVFGLCTSLGRILGEDADIEIVETHHRTKKDVPSGTALEMARLLGDAAGRPVVTGRGAGEGLRQEEIVIHSLRMGEVAGKHTIVLSSSGEMLEITHTAQSRACFAVGALRAARFAVEAGPGLYSMRDVLDLAG